MSGGLAACHSEEPEAVALLRRRWKEWSKVRVSILFSEGWVVWIVV